MTRRYAPLARLAVVAALALSIVHAAAVLSRRSDEPAPGWAQFTSRVPR